MKYIYNILLFLFSISLGFSQLPCGAPTMASYCDQACINCDLNGISLTTATGDQGEMPSGYCTAVVHHMQWLGFIAGSKSLTIEVDVTNCNVGIGIEMGIYSGCDPQNLVSNCNTFMPVGTYTFSTNVDLEVGCPYYLVFDGNGNAECDFDISVTSGSTSAPSVNISNIIGDIEVCVGETIKYSVNADGACSKMWTVMGGVIEGDDDQLEVDITWTTPGIGQVCFTGSNACDPGGMECIDVLVHPDVPDTELGPFKICEGDVYNHDGVDYTDGYYELLYKNDFDCDSLVILIVEEIPVYYEEREIAICEGECYDIGSKQFCIPGSFEVITQAEDAPFCDSVFLIELDIYVVHPVISQVGSLGCGDTLVILRTRDSSQFEGNGFRDYIWTDEDDNVIGIDDSLIVTKEGIYCVQVLMSSPDGVTCQNDTCFTVIGMDIVPELVIKSTPTICLGDSLDLTTIGVVEFHGITGVYTYHSGFPPTSNNEILPPVIFSEVDTTIVVKFESGSCGDTLIVPIIVSPSPDIEVMDTLNICDGDTLFLNDVMVISLNNNFGIDSFYNHSDLLPINHIINYIFTDSSQMIYVKTEISPCYDVDSFFLEVHTLPLANIGLLPDSICLDDVINFELTNYDQIQPIFDVDGGILSDLGAGNYQVNWTSSGWKKISLFVEDEFCLSSELCTDVFVQAPLIPVDLDCMTNDSTITFSWDKDNINGQYTVKIVSGQNIQNQTDSTLTVGNLKTREVVEVVIIVSEPGPCPDISDTNSCIAIFCPDVDIALPVIPLICLDNTTANIDLSPNVLGSDGTGILKWFGKGIIDSLSPTFNPSLAGEGTHIITVILEEQECFFNDEITIIVVRIPEIALTGSDTICLDSFANLFIDTMWTNQAIATWDFGDANAVPGNGISNQSLTWNSPGMKTVSLVLTKNGCTSEMVVKNFWVDPPLEPIVIQCQSTFTSIELNWNTIQNVSVFNVVSLDNYPITNISPTSVIIENLQPGTTTSFIVTALSNNSCADVVKEITCSTIECPIIDIQMKDTSACLSDALKIRLPITINGNISVGNPLWSGAGITDDSNGEFDPSIAGAGQHKIVFTFTNDVCVYKDSMVVELFDDPIADAGADGEINCTNSSIQLGGTNTSQGSDITYSWQGNLQDNTIRNPVVTEAGTYILTVLDENSGCLSIDQVVIVKNIKPPFINGLDVIDIGCDSIVDKGVINFTNLIGDEPFEVSINNQAFIPFQTSIADLQKGIYNLTIRDRKGCTVDTTVEIHNDPKINVDLGPDLEVDEGESVLITALTNINYINIDWTAGQNLPCQNCDVQAFVPNESMIVTVTVTDIFGCRSTDEINIKVKIKSIYVPNTFTPNGDGINDEIIIFGSDEVESIKLMDIYNRWGELVFHQTDLVPGQKSAGWKGVFNGKDLNPDVFILHAIIKFKDGTETVITQDITLIR